MKAIFTIVLCFVFAIFVSAQEFSKWTFNSANNDNNVVTGTLNPSVGSGTLNTAGNIVSSFKAGYPLGINDNSGLYTANYPAQGTANATAGIEVAASTAGQSNIYVSWWQLHSASSSRYVLFQYSIDGGATWVTPNFTLISTFGSTGIIDATNNLFISPTSGQWYYRIINLSTIPEINNNPNFRFKIVAAFGPYANDKYVGSNGGSYKTTGAWAFDDVTVRQNSPLPLQLSTFSASLKDGATQLNWQSYNEVNFSHFIIQESADAINYSDIGKVVSNNISNGSKYSFTDNNKRQPVSYYRLKMVDKDGSFFHSQVVLVNRKVTTGIIVYPNPTTDNLLLTHPEAKQKATIQIISASGKRVSVYPAQIGAIQTSMNVTNLGKGTYFVVFTNGSDSNRQTLKFIKK